MPLCVWVNDIDFLKGEQNLSNGEEGKIVYKISLYLTASIASFGESGSPRADISWQRYRIH